MSHLCLDTSAYSHFKRGATQPLELIRQARSIVLPAVVLGELRTGFRLGSRPTENETELSLFLAESIVTIAEIGDRTSALFAELVCDLRRQGTPLPTNDIWIAAAAAETGTTVLTYDEHFKLVSRVGCQVLA